jgi:hypothetical protein
MTQMTFDEVLDEPPGEEGDDSVNTPDNAPTTTEDDLEDADDLDDDDDDDE